VRVFLDTEFTDFTDPKLISCGLVAENGSEFYVELSDAWMPEQCSEFVQSVVLPRLDRSAATTLCRSEAGVHLAEWLASQGNSATLIHDAAVDWHLCAELLRAAPGIGTRIAPQLLSWPGSAMARHYALLLAKNLANDAMRHHALFDARAVQRAVLQTEADFRR
jgi:hypothetical protein